MRNFVKPQLRAAPPELHDPSAEGSEVVEASNPDRPVSPNLIAAVWPGYESDLPEDAGIDELSDDEFSDEEDEDVEPRMKRRRRRTLEVPAREARRIAREKRRKDLEKALTEIEKLIKSRKTQWSAGEHGVQARRARAIQSYFHLVVRKGYRGVQASQMAAETHGFGKTHSGRLIRQWGNAWLTNYDLPKSKRGCHRKLASLLDDPDIAAEIRSYLRSNKWATNPAKLADFTNNKLLPDEAEKYLHHIVNKEMPAGMKRHLEYELFPRIQLKVGKGICVSTARRWMLRNGFHYMRYKKALYFDGHERPDVVDYRQNVFLPAMAEYRDRLVEYRLDNIFEEVIKNLPLGVRKLVLCPHDESTMQSNDGQKAGWGPENEMPLLKKGVGRGSHRSDVICSTVGWLRNAGQQLEYGKNYDGYWTGELFVKQV